VIAASFLNNYNKIVADVKKDPGSREWTRARSAERGQYRGTRRFDLRRRDALSQDRERARRQRQAASIGTLKKSEELVFREEGRYLHVQGATGEGWVKKVLVSKK
jgi:hypothetical protein